MTQLEEVSSRPESRNSRDKRPESNSIGGKSSIVGAFASRYGLVGVWAIMAAAYALLMPDKFLNVATFQAIFGSQQAMVFLSMAVLCTLVVGEFDLSFASVMGLSATIVAVLAGLHDVNIVLACLIALAASALCGALNAIFVIKLGISSLIVTLGVGTLLVGIAEMLSDTNTVSVSNEAFAKFTLTDVLGLPISFFYGLLVAGVFTYVLGWTPLGRHMLFIGANPEVARLAGVRVDRVRAGAYVCGATLSGLAGIMLVSSVGGFDPSASHAYLLPAFAAVFLSSAVVQPGQFNPLGAMIGIYFLSTGILGLQLLGFSNWIQDVFYGGGLVIAVALATIFRNKATST